MSSDGIQPQVDVDPPVLIATKISKRYSFSHRHEWSMFGSHEARQEDPDSYLALDDISFDIRRGETVGILGRNGAGKSTLLQILTGVLQPTTGTVTTSGRVGALLELGSGFNPELSGRENMHLSAAVLGMSRKEAESKASSIEAFADIGTFIDKPVKTYSSGMLVRLAFSIQVHLEPDILIVDEALSVGDMFFQQKCIAKIREIISQGVTLLFVSHSINAVKSICRRAIFLDKGRIALDGPSELVCETYQNSMSSTSDIDLRHAVERFSEAASNEGVLRVEEQHPPQTLDQSRFEAILSNRSGGGEVRFTGFGISHNGKTDVTSLQKAARITLILQFEARQDIAEGAVIGLLVRDAHGVDLVAYNMNFYGKHLPRLAADRTYQLELDVEFPFAKGRYSFHCGIKPAHDSAYFYDRCFNTAVLDIEENPIQWGEYGGRLLATPHAMRLSVKR